MIGLLFLFGMGLWFIAAIMLSKRIPRWMGVTKHRGNISVLLFPLVLVAPIADDLIGRWQFYRLCDREAVVTLSPNANKVEWARRGNSARTDFEGYLIPIRSQTGEYVDIHTGNVFMTDASFYTDGGYLKRHLYGLGGVTSCHPHNLNTISKRLNIELLLKQGEMK